VFFAAGSIVYAAAASVIIPIIACTEVKRFFDELDQLALA
jgi:hypothetical protein